MQANPSRALRARPAPAAALALGVALALLFSSGCQVPRTWEYQPSSGRSFQTLPLVVGVAVPFDDQRPNSLQDSGGGWLGIVPLVLWGTNLSNRPEEGYKSHDGTILSAAEPSARERELQRSVALIRELDEHARLEAQLRQLQDERLAGVVEASGASLPAAAAVSLYMELKGSGLFQDVRLVKGPRDRQGCDIIIAGDLVRTEQRNGVIWYGVTIAAPVFWMLGLPPNTRHVRTAMRARVLDYEGRPLAEWEYHVASPTEVTWRWGAHYYALLPRLWSEINRGFAKDLGNFLASRPADYWASYANEARMAFAEKGRGR